MRILWILFLVILAVVMLLADTTTGAVVVGGGGGAGRHRYDTATGCGLEQVELVALVYDYVGGIPFIGPTCDRLLSVSLLLLLLLLRLPSRIEWIFRSCWLPIAVGCLCCGRLSRGWRRRPARHRGSLSCCYWVGMILTSYVPLEFLLLAEQQSLSKAPPVYSDCCSSCWCCCDWFMDTGAVNYTGDCLDRLLVIGAK